MKVRDDWLGVSELVLQRIQIKKKKEKKNFLGGGGGGGCGVENRGLSK